MKKGYLFLFSLLSTLYCLPVFSHAQIDFGALPGGVDLSGELSINLVPEIPRPGENVSVRLEMYTENLDSANISWFLNEKLVQKGKGLRTYSFRAPTSDETASLRVEVTLQNGTYFTKSIEVSPLNLDLLWEANSYTPPFYKGKALLPLQGQVKIWAIAPSTNLVYKWTVNNKIAQNLGGFGKNTAIINAPILGDNLEVGVLATDINTGQTAKKSILIKATYPSVLFYENDPLYGIIYEKPIFSIQLSKEEISIVTVPYNIGRDTFNDLTYIWRVNGIVTEGNSGRSAIFRKPEGATGQSRVSLGIESLSKPLQNTEGLFSVKF